MKAMKSRTVFLLQIPADNAGPFLLCLLFAALIQGMGIEITAAEMRGLGTPHGTAALDDCLSWPHGWASPTQG